MSAACRFCGSEKILEVCAKCSDAFSGTMPGRSPSDGYNFVPGLMQGGMNDYVEFDVCLACQRVQKDLFEYADKPRRGKKVWTLQEKLDDLRKRAEELLEAFNLMHAYNERDKIGLALHYLKPVDRCLPGLVRDLERYDYTGTATAVYHQMLGCSMNADKTGARAAAARLIKHLDRGEHVNVVNDNYARDYAEAILRLSRA